MAENKWSGERGQVQLEQVAPAVLLFHMVGHLDASVVPFFEAALDRLVAAGIKPDIFFDTSAMTGYESEFRVRMTDWHKRAKPLTRGNHVLVRSKIIAMGIAVANMATGQVLKPYSSPTEFAAAIEAAKKRA